MSRKSPTPDTEAHGSVLCQGVIGSGDGTVPEYTSQGCTQGSLQDVYGWRGVTGDSGFTKTEVGERESQEFLKTKDGGCVPVPTDWSGSGTGLWWSTRH